MGMVASARQISGKRKGKVDIICNTDWRLYYRPTNYSLVVPLSAK